jgi:hypothetical protein
MQTCLWCKKPSEKINFNSSDVSNWYCSEKCIKIALDPVRLQEDLENFMETLYICEECGKYDEKINKLAGNPIKWYCSLECANKARERIENE